jgi:F420-dependent methylenetetrahydromethanopterin dehydrogenase
MTEPTKAKEWHEDESNTALAVSDSPDENVGDEIEVDEYGTPVAEEEE